MSRRKFQPPSADPHCATCKARRAEYADLGPYAVKSLGAAFCQECGGQYEVLALMADLQDEEPGFECEDDDE